MKANEVLSKACKQPGLYAADSSMCTALNSSSQQYNMHPIHTLMSRMWSGYLYTQTLRGMVEKENLPTEPFYWKCNWMQRVHQC